jgi:hypothetical protein
VLPRLQGKPPFDKQKWTPGSIPLQMNYESLVEVGAGLMDVIRIQRSGTPEERDLLASLRGFQLKSKVTVSGTPSGKTKVKISFSAWICQALDRYDWDYSEHFTVPNPDFGSKDPGAVRPEDKSLTVYHSNAERLEKAGLAAPYDVESAEWTVTQASILQSAEVDTSRKL